MLSDEVRKVLKGVKMYWRDPYNGIGVEEGTTKLLALFRKVVPEEKKMTSYLGQSDEVDIYRKGFNSAIDLINERIK